MQSFLFGGNYAKSKNFTDEGAKLGFSGYYTFQNSSKNTFSTSTEASMLRRML